MATQTYIKRGQSYSPTLTFSGADADQISSVYQVYFSLYHEWGDPIFANTRVAAKITAGDSTLQVDDASVFAVNNHIIVSDGNPEAFKITGITSDTVTIDGTFSYGHNIGVHVSLENVATRASANNYSYTIDGNYLAASGVYKLRWRYVQSSVSTKQEVYVTVYQPYITEGEFFDFHPELEDDFGDFFDVMERKVRAKIDTYCGQSFDYYPGKTLTFDGSGTNVIYVALRLEDIQSATLLPNEDITEMVYIAPESNFYIRLGADSLALKPTFGDSSQFAITGSWGWSQVPKNITMAADVLLADDMNDDSEYLKHGIIEVYEDTHRRALDKHMIGSTGNLDADVLLLDYSLFIIGMI